MKMATAVRVLINLLLVLHFSRAQKSSDITSLVMLFSLNPQFFVSLLLLGLTVVLSGCIYLWVLRYICIGCCQPFAVGSESEVLNGIPVARDYRGTPCIHAVAMEIGSSAIPPADGNTALQVRREGMREEMMVHLSLLWVPQFPDSDSVFPVGISADRF
ncbi:hypothetical protein FQN60_006349, partial [Etheostoma spectabile]